MLALYIRRPVVNVPAFIEPKQEPATARASTREPIGPKTVLPKATATVFELAIISAGSTKV